MKVLLATSMPIPHTGGLSTHFELLGSLLREHGSWAGAVIGQDGDLDLLAKMKHALRALGRSGAYRAASLMASADRLMRTINRLAETADIVHCHDALASYAAVNASTVKERRLPVVQTVHGPWSREILTSGISPESAYYRTAHAIEELAYSRCDAFIAVDRGQADVLIREFRVPAAKISIVHNATDCARTAALARQPGSPDLPAPYFIVPRRLVAKNGVHVAIDALALLPETSVNLVVAGDGPLASDLKNRAIARNIGGRVHFLGSLPHSQLLPLMALSAGVIVPSVPCEGVIEATSLAVIEAFACGAPVIASAIGGLAELIQHGRTGLLFPAGDATALSETVTSLLRMSAAERERMCGAALSAAWTSWDVKPWFARITGAYQCALNETACLTL